MARFLLCCLVAVRSSIATIDLTPLSDDFSLIQTSRRSPNAAHALQILQNTSSINMMNTSAIVSPNLDTCSIHSVSASNCTIDWSRMKMVQMAAPEIPEEVFGLAVIKVAASSVNPCEWKNQFLGNSVFGVPLDANSSYPYVTGTDFAGTVVKSQCDNFANGDLVWGLDSNTHSEYIMLSCEQLSKKPSTLSLLQAGTLGVAGMTGVEALYRAGAPWPKNVTVLVVGGSSGTGHFGIQLAKALGAKKVITTVSAGSIDLVKSLGADEAIDYHTTNWWEAIPAGSVDVIYDCISLPGSGNHAYDILADHGQYVALLDQALANKSHTDARPSVSQQTFILSWTDSKKLDILTSIADAGNLTVHIGDTFEGLANVPHLFNTSLQGHAVGKLALIVNSADIAADDSADKAADESHCPLGYERLLLPLLLPLVSLLSP